MSKATRAPAARAAAWKEALHSWRDRSVVMLVFVAPLLMAAITSLAFQHLNNGNAADIGIVTRDHGAITTAFVKKALPSVTVGQTSLVRPIAVPSYADAVRETANGDLAAAIVIPDDFSSQVASGKNPPVTLITGNDNSVGVPLAETAVRSLVSQVTANRLGVQLAVTGPHAARLTPALIRDAVNFPQVIRITQNSVGSNTLRPASYFGPSMLILALFFCGQIASRALVSERRRQTLDRIVMTGASLGSIILAKYVTAFVIGAASAVVLLGTLSAFGATFGSLGALAVLIGLTAAAMIGLSSLVVLVARTEEQAASLSTVMVFVLAILGGNFVPLSHIPPLLEKLSLLTPNGWALHAFAYLSLAPSDPLSAIAPQLIALACFALALGAPAIVLARRMAWRSSHV
jgi:ABC-2 type transport system permease protein